MASNVLRTVLTSEDPFHHSLPITNALDNGTQVCGEKYIYIYKHIYMLISVHISNLENQAEEYQAVTVTFGICYFKTQSYIKLHKHLLQMICALNRKEGAHLFFFNFPLQCPDCYLA